MKFSVLPLKKAYLLRVIHFYHPHGLARMLPHAYGGGRSFTAAVPNGYYLLTGFDDLFITQRPRFWAVLFPVCRKNGQGQVVALGKLFRQGVHSRR